MERYESGKYSMFKLPNLAVAAAAIVLAGAVQAGPLGIGSTATPEMIAGWDIDIRPDGMGLPPGQGSVAEGEPLYEAKQVVMVCSVRARVAGRFSRVVRVLLIRCTQKKPSALIGRMHRRFGTISTERCHTLRRSL